MASLANVARSSANPSGFCLGFPGNGEKFGKMFACWMIMAARMFSAWAWAKPSCSHARSALLRSANSTSPALVRPRPLLLPTTCNVRHVQRQESDAAEIPAGILAVLGILRVVALPHERDAAAAEA